MNAEQIINEIGDKQGWNDTTKLKLCLQYFDKLEEMKALKYKDHFSFKTFLETVASMENQFGVNSIS